MKLLIIEDDKALNDGIALSFSGSEILQAYSLEEARRFIDLKPDLAILDINLPDGSGLDFCREIRGFCQTPVIFLTANDMEIDIVAGLESGADDYITKPFSLAVLRARVNAVLPQKTDGRFRLLTGRVFLRFRKYDLPFGRRAGGTQQNRTKTAENARFEPRCHPIPRNTSESDLVRRPRNSWKKTLCP